MKIPLLLGSTILLGLALGATSAVVKIAAVPWQGYAIGAPDDPAVKAAARRGDGKPKVVIDKASYDFGSMDMNSAGQHSFVLSNAGDGVLRLSDGPTSCGCTGVKVERAEVAPGESSNVTVRWKAKKTPGQFQENATVITNDPANPRLLLAITGRMTASVEVVPPDLSLGQVAADQEARGEVRVFGYRAEPLKIAGYELSDRSSEKNYQVTWEQLPAAAVKEEQDARSGLSVRIKAKSGLPLGAIRQTIVLKTNYADRPTIEVPINGTVTGDLAIFGSGWNAENNVLNLGTVSGKRGTAQNLVIIARGTHYKEVQLKILAVTPDVLKAKLGPTVVTKGRAVSQTTLSIQVPAGSRPANYLGSTDGPLGKITIATGHPQVPELHILVSLAIEG